MDKVTLCRQMMQQSRDVARDDALSEVVGFLEACRPRMVDLVEAGVGGVLGESTFEKCLKVTFLLRPSSSSSKLFFPCPGAFVNLPLRRSRVIAMMP